MKQIKLSKGKLALVDDEDFEKLNKFKWHCTHQGYAVRNRKKSEKYSTKTIWLHKFLINAPAEIEIDHKDNNKLNNQKYNLRKATHAENLRNKSKVKNTSSKFKGVSWHKARKKWECYIEKNYKKIHIGYYILEVEAAKAYNQKAVELFGQFAKLNIKKNENTLSE